MAFAGVPNAKDRGDLVAYLKEAKWGLTEVTPNWFFKELIPNCSTALVLFWVDESAKTRAV